MQDERTSFLDDAQALLDQAAEPALERIRRDRKKVPPRLQPLLEHLETHLFDPALNVSNLKRACGIRDNSIAILFHAEVGHSPKNYISDRRLETAARLLRDTGLRIWQIGELIGYSSLGVFSKAFNRWAGQRPKTYRRQIRRELGASEGPRPPLAIDDDILRRALTGKLEDQEAERLIRRLMELYPTSRFE